MKTTTARVNRKITKLLAKATALDCRRQKHAALCTDLFADTFGTPQDRHCRALNATSRKFVILSERWWNAVCNAMCNAK